MHFFRIPKPASSIAPYYESLFLGKSQLGFLNPSKNVLPIGEFNLTSWFFSRASVGLVSFSWEYEASSHGMLLGIQGLPVASGNQFRG